MMILGRKIKSRQGKAVAYNINSTLALEYAIQIRILIQNISIEEIVALIPN